MTDRFKTKQDVREYVWKEMRKVAIPPFPVSGRIPNFKDSAKACERIRELEKYKRSKIVFSAPDSPLRRAREIVLEDNKILLAVKPRMTGFLILDSSKDVTIRGMLRNGKEIKENELHKLNKVDLFVQGCVAVDVNGNRIGKGSGYGDKEYALLKEHGLLDNSLYVVVAHDIQVFDDLGYLMGEHDVKADVILTPGKIIWCRH
ncbi:5-formyltetrahydrofolate cyclo-ligase [Archaeoglobales archaeon]|nr:MAG: 5-formyltetrahydrofolate cyclo-ligase [Archaeoglobales archaeon]